MALVIFIEGDRIIRLCIKLSIFDFSTLEASNVEVELAIFWVTFVFFVITFSFLILLFL